MSGEENKPENIDEPSSVEPELNSEPTDTVEFVEEIVSKVSEQAADEATVEEASGENASANQENWAAKVSQLEEELAGLKDSAIRAQAEAQNVRRRAEQDVEKAHKFALEKFAKELLPVIDGLEKAIEAEQSAGNEMTPLREGVEMTLSMLLGGVAKFGVEQVDPVGKPFDPALHEAMTMVPSPDAEPNTVIGAMQKGYTLNGRLLRPAMVMVAK